MVDALLKSKWNIDDHDQNWGSFANCWRPRSDNESRDGGFLRHLQHTLALSPYLYRNSGSSEGNDEPGALVCLDGTHHRAGEGRSRNRGFRTMGSSDNE